MILETHILINKWNMFDNTAINYYYCYFALEVVLCVKSRTQGLTCKTNALSLCGIPRIMHKNQ